MHLDYQPIGPGGDWLDGRIYFGSRAGRFFSLGDDGTLTSPTAAQTGGGGE